MFSFSRWSFVLIDVPLIFSFPTDHVSEWQPRILLGMVEARSVNVKNTTTRCVQFFFNQWSMALLLYIIINLFNNVLQWFCFVFVWYPCMAIHVSV